MTNTNRSIAAAYGLNDAQWNLAVTGQLLRALQTAIAVANAAGKIATACDLRRAYAQNRSASKLLALRAGLPWRTWIVEEVEADVAAEAAASYAMMIECHIHDAPEDAAAFVEDALSSIKAVPSLIPE